MKKIQRTTREAILYLTGKALALCGIIITFDGCFPVAYGPGPPPQPPKYWSDQAPEQVDPITKTITKTKTANHELYEQTTEINAQDDSADRR